MVSFSRRTIFSASISRILPSPWRLSRRVWFESRSCPEPKSSRWYERISLIKQNMSLYISIKAKLTAASSATRSGYVSSTIITWLSHVAYMGILMLNQSVGIPFTKRINSKGWRDSCSACAGERWRRLWLSLQVSIRETCNVHPIFPNGRRVLWLSVWYDYRRWYLLDCI